MEFCVKLLSLPLWERGLKYTIKVFKSMLIIVAPLVGAWIEISSKHFHLSRNQSLPLWERGLKLSPLEVILTRNLSLPLWERGLKYSLSHV